MTPPPLPYCCPRCGEALERLLDDVPLDACYHCGAALPASGRGRSQALALGADESRGGLRLRRVIAAGCLTYLGGLLMLLMLPLVDSARRDLLPWLSPDRAWVGAGLALAAWVAFTVLWVLRASAHVGQVFVAADGIHLQRGGQRSHVGWERLGAFRARRGGLDLLGADGRRLLRVPTLPEPQRRELIELLLARRLRDADG